MEILFDGGPVLSSSAEQRRDRWRAGATVIISLSSCLLPGAPHIIGLTPVLIALSKS